MTRDLDAVFRIRPLVLDGALGTELERRGVNTSGKSWTARSIETNPSLIYRTHREYLFEGAEIITANTFRTNPRALHGTEFDPEQLTKKAVRIACKARRDRGNPLVRVAGSIAPVEDCYSPELAPPSDRALVEEHRIMARWLDEAHVDIILIETMSTLREALCALEAVKLECTKYAWVSIVPKDGETMLDGMPIDYAIKRLKEAGAHLVALNCAPVSIMLEALPMVAKAAKKSGVWFGCFPNASEKLPDGTWNLRASNNLTIANGAIEWMKHGAALVGSCCHSTPRTTNLIRLKRDIFYALKEEIDISEDDDLDLPEYMGW
ncbi:MAG TPA: homocysteine S-methyltransferase family protein [Candidatus Kapabacteria bacterium]|jgi:S-methylmethionine-dependent homocysteine/selenocysteine methylase